MDFLSETLHTYYLLIKFDSSFAISFFGFLVQTITLLLAFLGLRQIKELKKQNALSVHRDKIDYLERFQSLIADTQKFVEDNTERKNYRLDLENYVLSELEQEGGPKRDVFNLWLVKFTNKTLQQEAYNLANRLELFAIAISREEVFRDIKNVIARSFCELVESNPAVYIRSRIPNAAEVHLRFQHTINLRKSFLKEVGSVEQRENQEIEFLRKYNYETKD